MGSIYMMVDLLFAGCGVYVLYAWYLMKTKGVVKENILMSREVSMKRCKDKDGYMKYIAPRILVFGIALTIVGLIGFADDYYKFLGIASLIMQGVGLAVIIYFAVVSKKSIKMFW